jgi:hypothetical protein
MFGGECDVAREIQLANRRRRHNNRLYRANILLCFAVILAVLSYTASNHLFEKFSILSGAQTEQLISYKIVSGDTLWEIANKVVTADEDVRNKIIAIQKLNKISSAQALIPGQLIQIPIARANTDDYKLTLNIR